MKKTSTYVGSLLLAGALLLSSCSTYNKLATQWKYRSDYKNPNQTGFVLNNVTTTPEATTTTETAPATAVATTSTEAVTTKEVRTMVKSVLKNNQISAKQVRAAIKEAKKLSPKSEKVEGKANAGFDKTIAIILSLLLFIWLGGIHRIYMYIVAKQTKDLLVGLVQFFTWGCFGIWQVIDIIRLITGDLKR